MPRATSGLRWRAAAAAISAGVSHSVRSIGSSSLLPGSRKARLWELFQELFGQLQTEAQDDFDELFGKAFLKAYEGHIDRLRDEPGPR